MMCIRRQSFRCRGLVRGVVFVILFYQHTIAMAGALSAIDSRRPAVRERQQTGIETSEWHEVTKLSAPDAAAGDSFGSSVALSEATIVIGALGKNQNTGAAYVYRQTGDAWQFEAKLEAFEASRGHEQFGSAVAVHGETAIVGALAFAPADSFAIQIGGLFVYQRVDSVWMPQQVLTAPNAGDFDYLGNALAFDGITLVAGAFGRADLQGAAYVYTQRDGRWQQDAELLASDGQNFDAFGDAVAVDVDTIVIGAPVQNSGTGAVYIFERSGSSWIEVQKLLTPSPMSTDQFGAAVALTGGVLVVSSPNQRVGESSVGQVFVYSRNGEQWTLQQQIASPPGFGTFGAALASSSDTIAISASPQNTVFLYTLIEGVWTEQSRLLLTMPEFHDTFGNRLAFDGNTLVGGSPSNGALGSFTGAAYVFAPGAPSPACLVVQDFETENPSEWPSVPIRGEHDACSTITGDISTGFGDPNNPDPNTDGDVYVLNFPGTSVLTQVQLTFTLTTPSGVPTVYQLFDLNGNLLLDCSPTPQQCQGTVGTNPVLISVAAQAPSAYTLQVTAVLSTATTPEGCLVIEDFETANPAELPIVPVRGEPGECTALTGAIATGFGDPATPHPNTDGDVYVLSFPGVSTHTQAQLTLTLPAPVNTFFIYQFLDRDGNLLLDCISPPQQCQVSVQTSPVFLLVFAQEASAYTIGVTAELPDP